MKTIVLLTGLIAVVPSIHAADQPVVSLDYGSFRGKYSAQYNITYFRRIPYAAPPTGQNRFGPPMPPANLSGTYDTDRSFPACPQGEDKGAEDCLYLSLYSRPWKDQNVKRPVMVFLHGGGFIRGGGGIKIPPSGYPTLNVNTVNDFIMIYPNHRLNAFGFLPGKKMKSNGAALNPGLLDQEYALKWVQKHITKFGGDPNAVTLWGQSAGGGGVVAQVLAQSSRKGLPLFEKALMSSPFYPRTYQYDSPEAEKLYSDFVQKSGCQGAQDSLQCLKAADVRVLQRAAANMSSDYRFTTSSFTWAPVIDGTFLVEPLSKAVQSKRINTSVAFGIYNTHEGENFIPSGLKTATGTVYNSTQQSFGNWLKGFLPKFDQGLIAQVKELYPELGETETFGYDTTFPRAGIIFRDVVLVCPEYWVAKGATTQGYIAEYTIEPARHASDVGIWNSISSLQDTGIYISFAGALASFIQTGNPNRHNQGITAPIPAVDAGQEWLIEEASGLHRTPMTSLAKRCDFWKENAKLVPL